VYDLFEDLHLILVKRIMAFQSSHAALADVTLNATTTTPAASVLMLNPASLQQYMAETLNNQFREWRDDNLIRLQKESKRRKDDLMQRHGDVHSFVSFHRFGPFGCPRLCFQPSVLAATATSTYASISTVHACWL
jgi:phage-related protein